MMGVAMGGGGQDGALLAPHGISIKFVSQALSVCANLIVTDNFNF